MSEPLKIIRSPQTSSTSPFTQVDFPIFSNYEPNIKLSQKTNETSTSTNNIRSKFSPDVKNFANIFSYKYAKNQVKVKEFNNQQKKQQKEDRKNKKLLTSSTMLETQHQNQKNQRKTENLIEFDNKNKNNQLNQKRKVKMFSPIPKKITTFHSSSPNNNNRKLVSPKKHLNQSQTIQSQQNNEINFHKEKQQNRCPSFFKKAKITDQIKKETQFCPENNKLFNLAVLDFKFIKFLGQGTFGDVYLALHKKTNSLFTIKRYRKGTIKQHQLQQKFIRDIKIQFTICHPNIVKMYGFFDDETFIYTIFQYMEQGNLWKLIQQRGGNISQTQIAKKVTQINGALIYLHQKKLIHRDIKPQSILVCHNLCKLCDTEWIQSVNQKSQTAVLCRQIDYTAPQALQGKQINSNFDVWGLGLISFQMITGKKLFNAVTQKGILRKIITIKSETIQKQLPSNISTRLKQFIIQALNPVPTKRISSLQIQKLQIFKKHVKQRKWLGQQKQEQEQEDGQEQE